MSEKKIKILNCPKCHGRAETKCVLQHWNDFVVRCSNCGFTYGIFESEKNDAIKKWNDMVSKELTKE